MTNRHRTGRLAAIALVFVLGLTACARSRYVVTAQPMDLGVGSGRYCVAIDPRDARGVWWWEPGLASRTDCSHRSTAPSVFHADGAAITASTQPGITDVRFRIGLHARPGSGDPASRDIRLRLDGAHLRSVATGAEVGTVDRKDLLIPADPR